MGRKTAEAPSFPEAFPNPAGSPMAPSRRYAARSGRAERRRPPFPLQKPLCPWSAAGYTPTANETEARRAGEAAQPRPAQKTAGLAARRKLPENTVPVHPAANNRAAKLPLLLRRTPKQKQQRGNSAAVLKRSLFPFRLRGTAAPLPVTGRRPPRLPFPPPCGDTSRNNRYISAASLRPAAQNPAAAAAVRCTACSAAPSSPAC